jgi:hypothetical protein
MVYKWIVCKRIVSSNFHLVLKLTRDQYKIAFLHFIIHLYTKISGAILRPQMQRRVLSKRCLLSALVSTDFLTFLLVGSIQINDWDGFRGAGGVQDSVRGISSHARFPLTRERGSTTTGSIKISDTALKKSDNILTSLDKNTEIAHNLLTRKFYNPLIAAVVSCNQIRSSFVVIDCPSGAGKSLSGIALRLLDSKQKFENGNLPHLYPKIKFRVAHVVWPEAISCQDIYEQIHREQEEQGLYVDYFYDRARKMLETMPTKNCNLHVWETCLQYLFVKEADNSFNLLTFKEKYGLDGAVLVLFLDEIPASAGDVETIGKIRDAIKCLSGVVVILASSNSKAANMIEVIGLSSHAASANVRNKHGDAWSLYLTRLPRFDVDASLFKEDWLRLRKRYEADPFLKSVIETITSSMSNNGNPGLITFAIMALMKVAEQKQVSFPLWQRLLAKMNQRSKFLCNLWSDGFNMMVGQANLLLNASADSSMSDVLIQSHYAQRAVPDGGAFFGTDENSESIDCGGWLYISPTEWRGLGNQLKYENARWPFPMNWQVTVFQSVSMDILLYLSCCLEHGYFSIEGTEGNQAEGVIIYTAYDVVAALWKRNSFGYSNVQNDVAPINTGSFLEVLTVLSIINAGAVSDLDSIQLPHYLCELVRQLGVNPCQCHASSLLLNDSALSGLYVPRLLFPGDESLRLPFTGYGTVHRAVNRDQYDVLLAGVTGRNDFGISVQFIRCEAKFRERFYMKQVIEAACKVVQCEGDIGVIVVKQCCQFWYEDGARTRIVRANLLNLTAGLRPGHVGRVYLVSLRGTLQAQTIDDAKSGRLFLIQAAPEQYPPAQTSLCPKIRFAGSVSMDECIKAFLDMEHGSRHSAVRRRNHDPSHSASKRPCRPRQQ